MQFNNVEGMATASTATYQKKGSASKIQVPFPDLIKMYKKGMGCVDLIDQRAATCYLNQKSRRATRNIS